MDLTSRNAPDPAPQLEACRDAPRAARAAAEPRAARHRAAREAQRGVARRRAARAARAIRQRQIPPSGPKEAPRKRDARKERVRLGETPSSTTTKTLTARLQPRVLPRRVGERRILLPVDLHPLFSGRVRLSGVPRAGFESLGWSRTRRRRTRRRRDALRRRLRAEEAPGTRVGGGQLRRGALPPERLGRLRRALRERKQRVDRVRRRARQRPEQMKRFFRARVGRVVVRRIVARGAARLRLRLFARTLQTLAAKKKENRRRRRSPAPFLRPPPRRRATRRLGPTRGRGRRAFPSRRRPGPGEVARRRRQTRERLDETRTDRGGETQSAGEAGSRTRAPDPSGSGGGTPGRLPCLLRARSRRRRTGRGPRTAAAFQDDRLGVGDVFFGDVFFVAALEPPRRRPSLPPSARPNPSAVLAPRARAIRSRSAARRQYAPPRLRLRATPRREEPRRRVGRPTIRRATTLRFRFRFRFRPRPARGLLPPLLEPRAVERRRLHARDERVPNVEGRFGRIGRRRGGVEVARPAERRQPRHLRERAPPPDRRRAPAGDTSSSGLGVRSGSPASPGTPSPSPSTRASRWPRRADAVRDASPLAGDAGQRFQIVRAVFGTRAARPPRPRSTSTSSSSWGLPAGRARRRPARAATRVARSNAAAQTRVSACRAQYASACRRARAGGSEGFGGALDGILTLGSRRSAEPLDVLPVREESPRAIRGGATLLDRRFELDAVERAIERVRVRRPLIERVRVPRPLIERVRVRRRPFARAFKAGTRPSRLRRGFRPREIGARSVRSFERYARANLRDDALEPLRQRRARRTEKKSARAFGTARERAFGFVRSALLLLERKPFFAAASRSVPAEKPSSRSPPRGLRFEKRRLRERRRHDGRERVAQPPARRAREIVRREPGPRPSPRRLRRRPVVRVFRTDGRRRSGSTGRGTPRAPRGRTSAHARPRERPNPRPHRERARVRRSVRAESAPGSGRVRAA